MTDLEPAVERHAVFRDPLSTHVEAGKGIMASGELFAADLAVFAILQRSLDLVSGVKALILEENFTCAVALSRLQLDSLTRLTYMATLPNADEFAMQVLSGGPLYKVKDAQGKALTDKRLRAYAAKLFPWVEDLYEKASRFIHFSDEHMFTSTQLDKEREDPTLILSIVEKPDRWSTELIDEFADAFAYITEHLLEVVDAWGEHKVALSEKRRQLEGGSLSEPT